jgi:hypothetical protein
MGLLSIFGLPDCTAFQSHRSREVTAVHIGSEDFDVNDVIEAIEILVTISAEHYDVVETEWTRLYLLF